MQEDSPSMECSDTLSRRRVLGSLGAAGALALAGCSGGGNGNGATGGNDNGTGGNGNGATGGNGNGATGGNGNGATGVGGVDLSGGIGDALSGTSVSMMVEYVRPVEEVLEFERMPRTDESEGYGTPRTVDHYASLGLAKPGEQFYGIGLAIKNTSDTFVDVSTVLLFGEDTTEFGSFPGRTQRLTYRLQGRGSGAVLSPGERVRGEMVFALEDEPSNYSLVFDPRKSLTGETERFEVDLASGSEATASLGQDVTLESMGGPVPVGDFEVTLHDVTFAESVTDSPHQDLFGPRPGYRYAIFDLSATRTDERMYGQDWALGVGDDEGYTFSWRGVYQDAVELNRTPLEDLAVGETIDHTLLAFPLSTEFDPAYVAMTAIGPFEPPSQFAADEGMDRTCWALP